jgi:lipid-binding SYLF domain-containing protein
MRAASRGAVGFVAAMMLALPAWADRYDDTVNLFKNAGQSAAFFDSCYGYAVFPTIGKGAFIIGGAHGSGQVYQLGRYVGDAKVTEVSVGFQAGGEGYSQIIFFQDERAFQEFTRGQFEFGADVSAVAITAAASGEISTGGVTASASGGMKDAVTAGGYYKGFAIFVIYKGGAMFEASLAGQKYSYKPQTAGQPAGGSGN